MKVTDLCFYRFGEIVGFELIFDDSCYAEKRLETESIVWNPEWTLEQ